jgi:hypothetical protein
MQNPSLNNQLACGLESASLGISQLKGQLEVQNSRYRIISLKVSSML